MVLPTSPQPAFTSRVCQMTHGLCKTSGPPFHWERVCDVLVHHLHSGAPRRQAAHKSVHPKVREHVGSWRLFLVQLMSPNLSARPNWPKLPGKSRSQTCLQRMHASLSVACLHAWDTKCIASALPRPRLKREARDSRRLDACGGPPVHPGSPPRRRTARCQPPWRSSMASAVLRPVPSAPGLPILEHRARLDDLHA